jgi:hypothetical protein
MQGAPVVPCDGWTDAQAKAFRLMVIQTVSWAATQRAGLLRTSVHIGFGTTILRVRSIMARRFILIQAIFGQKSVATTSCYLHAQPGESSAG